MWRIFPDPIQTTARASAIFTRRGSMFGDDRYLGGASAGDRPHPVSKPKKRSDVSFIDILDDPLKPPSRPSAS